MVCLTSFGDGGLPQMVHKFFYAIRDRRSVRIGAIVSTLFATLIGGCAYLAGSFSRVVLNISDPAAVGGVDKLVPEMLFCLDAGMDAGADRGAGAVRIDVYAAITGHGASSAIAIDLVKGVFNPNMSDKAVKGLMRGLCAAFVVVSLIIALGQVAEIVTLMSMSWGHGCRLHLGPYLFGVVSKRTNKRGRDLRVFPSDCCSPSP